MGKTIFRMGIRSLMPSCLLALTVLGMSGHADGALAIPAARLRDGNLVNLATGKILTGPERGKYISRVRLYRLRQLDGYRGDRNGRPQQQGSGSQQ